MLSKMKTVLLVLLLLGDSLAVPTIDDNKIPTDQEILGQPEEVSPLGLPTDEESFNRLSVLFNPGKPPGQVGSGTYHFVSSTFPVDARGFHESVFDGIGDYFPSWPAPYKRDSDPPYSPSLAQRLGLRPHNRFRKRSSPNSWSEQEELKKKQDRLYSSNFLRDSNYDSLRTADFKGVHEKPVGNQTERSAKRLFKREALSSDSHNSKPVAWFGQNKSNSKGACGENYCDIGKRSGARYVRGMEMGSSGFHGDIFSRDFGDFTTMKKRLKGSAGFHGDTFSSGFGDFETMKRAHEKDMRSKLKEIIRIISADDGDDENISLIVDPENGLVSNVDGINAIIKRKPEMTSMGFHGDTFNGGFGDFYPVKKRKHGMNARGFHGDTFSQGFGDFDTYRKRAPSGSMGFHGDTFSQGFGDFDTYRKRAPSGSMGFHGDTFSQGFGDFDTYKKRAPSGSMGFHGDTFSQGFGDFDTYKKRAPSGSMGFHGDTFSQGFGDFDTYKRAPSGSMGFHGDTFSQGFGDFDTYKKRAPSGSMGFHGDTFSQGFGDFDTYKKRAPSGSMGFHGDTFSQGFGDFDTYKKRAPSGSMGFHGDTFSQGFGDFDTLKKRKPNGGSMGFHGDTFSQGFGDFDTLKKRRPNGGSVGFHGDTFSQGFGDFEPLKKRSLDTLELYENLSNQGVDAKRKRSVHEVDSETYRTDEADEEKTEGKRCCSDSIIQRHQEVH